MTFVRLGAACFMLAGALGANAQGKPCTKSEAAAAEKAIERVVMWTQLEKAWHDYRHCDSGAVGDLYTDALLRLLVDWKKPEALAEAVAKDPDYKAFVIAHIRSPVAKDDREAIYSRAKADCPGNLAAFCSEIADAAKVK